MKKTLATLALICLLPGCAAEKRPMPEPILTQPVPVEAEPGNNPGSLFEPGQADFLFDRGFITFGDGRLLVSPVADEKSMVKLGVDPDRPPVVGAFTREQERFLEFHRAEIFRSANAG